MKHVSFLVYCFFVTLSCKNTGQSSSVKVYPKTVTLHEGRWISNFKNEVFIQCLNKLFPSELNATLDSVDGSSSANLEQLDYNQQVIVAIDSIATSFSKRNEPTWALEQRRVTINVCLSYRNSTELDSLARHFYKKFAQ